MSNLVVLIMAGGLGKRMNSNLPKVLHNICGKPMLIHIIEQAFLLSPIKIGIIVGKYKDIIKQTLLNYISLENIEFISQNEPLGTGHAIQCCIHELQKYTNSNVIILSGDVPMLKSDTMREMTTNVNKVKIMTTEFDNPTGYGRIIEQNNLFVKIIEEKDCDQTQKQIRKINCGIYTFNTEILCKYLMDLTNNNSQGEYYLTDIIEIIRRRENIDIEMLNIVTHKHNEITGINTVEQLLELEKLMEIQKLMMI